MLWLSGKTGKALLKLDDDDFRQHNLHQLLRHHGPAQSVAHRVFRWMMDTIEYHPAGRDQKRVICFSPHPDDDVISMGGTLIRLVEDGHEVHVAYMTSGNIAVFDHDARQIADLVAEFNRLFGIDQGKSRDQLETGGRGVGGQSAGRKRHGRRAGDQVAHSLERSQGRGDRGRLPRRAFALSRLAVLSHGHDRQKAAHRGGRGDLRELIERVQPAQIYVAGDLSDPHGTHRVCAEAIFPPLDQLTSGRPEVLLYRGAWQEWPPHEIEIAVPLSPRDLDLKRAAIFRHESQKDAALFPGPDPREFWQRAEDRNRHTADVYNQLGLPEYFALEGFVRWNGVGIWAQRPRASGLRLHARMGRAESHQLPIKNSSSGSE